jgi:hypothetical protein
MQAAQKPLFKASSFDIMVTRLDAAGTYHVSGKDAALFHAKLNQSPHETAELIIGELKNGSFTMQKPASCDNALKTTATAG